MRRKKTTVGQRLAQRIRAEFVDCDEYIETKTHLTIGRSSTRAGSHISACSKGTRDQKRCAASTAGSSPPAAAPPLRYKNIHNLKNNGVVFPRRGPDERREAITADPKSRSRRPPLTQKDLKSEVREQVGLRRDYYLKAADFTVRTDQRNAEEVVLEIVARLKTRGLASGGDDRDASLA